MSAVEADRHVVLESAFNFRDLGGYPPAVGAGPAGAPCSGPTACTASPSRDLEILRRLGLCTVIDLRTENELVERGRFPIEAHPVGYHHLSLMDVIWDPAEAPPPTSRPPSSCSASTSRCSSRAEDRVAEAFRILAAPGRPARRVPLRRRQGPHRGPGRAAAQHARRGRRRRRGRLRPHRAGHDPHAGAVGGRERGVRGLRWRPPRRRSWPPTPPPWPACSALIRQAHGSTRDYVRSLGVTTPCWPTSRTPCSNRSEASPTTVTRRDRHHRPPRWRGVHPGVHLRPRPARGRRHRPRPRAADGRRLRAPRPASWPPRPRGSRASAPRPRA